LGVDAIVLGCTHYPFARGIVERLCGPAVAVIDPAPAVARQAHRVLEEARLVREPGGTLAARSGHTTFLTSAEPAELRIAVRRLAGDDLAERASFGYLPA
jgi:glutamate racemase